MSNHKKNQQPDEQEKLENREVKNVGNALNILTKEIVDEFIELVKSGNINLGTSNFGEAFVNFLRSKRPELFEKLKKSLGKIDGLTWEDIKDLYLESHSTLEVLLTKEIFKNLKLKDAVRGVVKVFVDKIENLLSSDPNYQQLYQPIILDLKNEVNTQQLNTSDEVENFLDYVRSKFNDLLTNIPNLKLKNKLRKLKATNKEIIKALKDLGIITEAEAVLIGNGDIGGIIKNTREVLKEKILSSISQDKLEQLNDLLENLLFANVVDFIYNSKEKLDSTIAYLRNGFKVPSLSEVVNFDSDSFLNWLSNSPFLVQLMQIKPCAKYLNGDTTKKQECYKTLIEENLDLFKKLFVEYIKNVNGQLGQVLEKVIIQNKNISEQDKQILVNTFYGDRFKEHLLDILTISYNLSDNERNSIRNILNQLLDFSNNKLILRTYNGENIEIDVKKDLYFCQDSCDLKEVNDLLNLYPVLDFEFVNLENSPVLKIFENDLIKIKDIEVSPYQKVKIRDNKGQEIEGYLNLAIDDNGNQIVEILRKPIYEVNKADDVIQTLSLEDIDKVIPLEPLKYRINTEQEAFKKFILTFPQFISEKVAKYLEDEQVKSKIDDMLPRTENKEYNQVKEKLQENKETIKGILKEINYELGKLQGEEFKINNLEDLKKYCLMVQAEHIGIKGYENEFIQVLIKDIGNDKVVVNFEGGIKDIPDDKKQIEIDLRNFPDFLKRLNMKFKSFKYTKLGNYQQFENRYNNTPDLWLESKYKVNWQRRQNSTKVENKKFYKKDNDERKEVKYFVKGYKKTDENDDLKDQIAIYSVVLGNNGYELRVCQEIDIKKGDCIRWKKIKSDMSYNHLIMWLTDETEFYPMTDEEFKIKIDNIYNKNDNIGKLGWNWFSISTLLFSVKNIVNAVKHHFEEDKEIKSALVYQRLVNLLPGGSWMIFEIFEELKDEAGAELDSRIWGYINKFKNRLVRTDDGKGGAHGSKAAEVIKREIFEKVKGGKELGWKERLKAAGYLLYAVEKGPGPYFRGLGAYNGQGFWIKALLGNEAYNQWLKQNADLISKLKADPDNTAIKDELVSSELRFIYSHEKTGELFSKNFAPTLEGLTDNLYSVARAEQVYEDMAKKGNFYDLEVAFGSYINNFRIPHAVGTFKALAERVEDEEHYINIYKDLLRIGLSGFVFSELRGEDREYFNKICRTYGYQIGTLFHSADNLQKLLRFMDLIIKRKGIKLEGDYETFTEYIFGKKGLKPEQVDYYDFKNVNQSYLKSMRKKLDVLRSYAGKDIVSVLDVSDKIIFDFYKEENISDEDKKAVDAYFNSLNETLDDDWVIDLKKMFVTKDAPYWLDGALNLGRKLFNELVKTDEGDFVYESKAEAVVNAILDKLYSMEDGIDNVSIYEFLIKKFNSRFGGYYENVRGGQILKQVLLERIDNIDEKEFKEIITKPLYDKFSYGNKIPESLKEMIDIFAILIYKGAKNYIKTNKSKYIALINNVFKEQFKKAERWERINLKFDSKGENE